MYAFWSNEEWRIKTITEFIVYSFEFGAPYYDSSILDQCDLAIYVCDGYTNGIDNVSHHS